MNKKYHILILLTLALAVTLLIQLDLTRAIFFEGYLRTREILFGGDYYLALVNESSKGNWSLGNPFYREWRDEPYLYPALNINAAGIFKKALGADLKITSIILGYGSVFILTALIILLFLTIFRFSYFGYLAAIYYIFFPRMIGWDQVISPQINFIFLMLFLILYFARFEFWKRELSLGLSAGILFYTYPYHWTYALPLLVLTDAWVFISEWRIKFRHLWKYLIVAAMGTFYFWHLWRISQLSYYQETMVRIGLLYSRLPAGFITQAVTGMLLIFLYFTYRLFLKKHFEVRSPDFQRMTIGALVAFIVLNQQLVTGMQLEFNSHYLPVILVFAVALTGGIVLICSQNWVRLKGVFVGLSVIVAMSFVARGIYHRLAAPVSADGRIRFSQDEAAVIDWFTENGIRNAVVYAPTRLNNQISLLTDNYLYFQGSAELHLMPTAEIIDRFIYFDLANSEITDNLSGYSTAIFGQTFKAAWQKDYVLWRIGDLLGGGRFLPPTLDQYLKYDFESIRRKRLNPDWEDFNSRLDKYNVDYLIYESAERNGIYREVPGDIVFENSSYLIKKRFGPGRYN